jgi:hypothetical protein
VTGGFGTVSASGGGGGLGATTGATAVWDEGCTTTVLEGGGEPHPARPANTESAAPLHAIFSTVLLILARFLPAREVAGIDAGDRHNNASNAKLVAEGKQRTTGLVQI